MSAAGPQLRSSGAAVTSRAECHRWDRRSGARDIPDAQSCFRWEGRQRRPPVNAAPRLLSSFLSLFFPPKFSGTDLNGEQKATGQRSGTRVPLGEGVCAPCPGGSGEVSGHTASSSATDPLPPGCRCVRCLLGGTRCTTTSAHGAGEQQFLLHGLPGRGRSRELKPLQPALCG